MGGLAVSLGDRPGHGFTIWLAPSTIDNTLYDAFGQRQINTMYTQVNQYHVVLESEPQFQLDPQQLNILHPVECVLGCDRNWGLHLIRVFFSPDHLPRGRMRSLVLPVHSVGKYAYSSGECAFPNYALDVE